MYLTALWRHEKYLLWQATAAKVWLWMFERPKFEQAEGIIQTS